MKKILLPALLFFLAPLFAAHASTLTLSPSSATVLLGQTVTVQIAVNPASSTVAALKAELSYPANLLTPTSFVFAPNWIAVTQSGFDAMSGGVVVKAAGYPGGLTSPAVFGTVTFTAKSAGVATVGVMPSTAAYGDTGAIVPLSSQGSVRVTVAAPQSAAAVGAAGAAQAAPEDGNAAPEVNPLAKISHAAENKPASAASSSSAAAVSTSSQAAAAAEAVPGGVGKSFWWLWLIIAIALVAGGAVAYRTRKRV